MGFYLTLSACILFEIVENTSFIIHLYKTTYPSFDGDSIMNILGDVLSGVLGYILAYKWAYKWPRLFILFVIVVQLWLVVIYPYKEVWINKMHLGT